MATKSGPGYFRATASKVVMRAGRHFARFMVMEGDALMFGVIRPGYDVEGGQRALDEEGHCFYGTHGGRRLTSLRDWEGFQPAREQGDRIGMLLDLDQGSMTVWKNGVKLGVMQSEGLRGPLCWAVSVYFSGAMSARVADGGGAGSGEGMEGGASSV